MPRASRPTAGRGPGPRGARFRPRLSLLAFGLAYLAAAELGHLLTVRGAPMATLWPPAGLYVAVLLLHPARRWPALALAALAANLASDTLLHGRQVAASLGFCAANAAEAFLGAWLARRLAGGTAASPAALLGRLGGVAALLAGAVAAGPALGALIGAATVHLASGAPYGQTWALWFVGDALGVLVVAPVMLGALGLRRSSAAALAEHGGVALAAAALAAASLLLLPPSLRSLVLGLPPMLWGAVRQGSCGAAAGLLGAAAAVAAVLADRQPPAELLEVVRFQGSLLVFGIACHLLAAVVAERGVALRRAVEVEARLQAVLDHIPAAVVLFDASGRILFANAGVERVFRHPLLASADAGAYGEWESYHADGRRVEIREYPMARALATAESAQGEYHYACGDGVRRWVSITGAPVRDAEGRMAGAVVVCADTDDRRRAEAALAESEALLRHATEAGRTGTWSLRLDTLEADLSPVMMELLGLPPGPRTVPAETWRGVVHPDDLAGLEAAIAASVAEGIPFVHEFRLTPSGLAAGWIDARGGVARDAVGRTVRLEGASADITERKRADARKEYLLAVTKALRDLDDPVAMMDAATGLLGRHLGVAQVGFGEVDAAQELVAVDRDWNDGRIASVVGTWRIDDFGPAFVADLKAGRTVAISDIAQDPRTGAPAVAAAYEGIGTRAILDVPLVRGGRMVAMLFIHHPEPRAWTTHEVALVEETCGRLWDAVERARAERALAESEARLRGVFDSTFQYIGLLAPDGTLLDANWASLEGAGVAVEAVRGRPFWEGPWWAHDLALRERLKEGIAKAAGGEFVRFEAQHPLRDGTLATVDFSLSPVRDAAGRIVLLVPEGRDITDRKRAEAELRRLNTGLEARVREAVAGHEAAQARLAHAQRMEALGQLAGGIAHDFNNVLQAVQGGAALIERRPADVEGVRRLARMVADATGRGASITRRLLAFSRRGDLRAEAVDPVGLLAGLREILVHTLGAGVGVRVDAAPGLPPLLADKGQLETVLVNLATNARDAMAGNGVLTVDATTEVLAPGDTAHHPALGTAGTYLCLAVADTGAGMPPEVLARVTEPFFTTKPKGKGTGLGLSMAKGFAEQSGGGLSIESAPGRGTTVRLWLPMAAADAAAAAPSPVGDADPASAGKRARVLVVDDDAVVCEVLAGELEAAGYAVLAASGGCAALALLDAGEAVDLVVSDLSMPDMDGVALIREAQRRRPQLPAILLTGSAPDAVEIAVGGAVSGAFFLLRKPTDGQALAGRIAVLLEGEGTEERISSPNEVTGLSPTG